ncbi:hypothetical protein ACHAWF_018436 [Thalassiosira exigua]
MCLCLRAPSIVGAFSSSSFRAAASVVRPRGRGGRVRPAAATRLREQPANLRELLGPIAPATLERYELSPEELAGEEEEEGGRNSAWAAQFVSRTAKGFDEANDVRLVPRDPKERYVDGVTVEVPVSRASPGLGIELLELEGGRDDGLGIAIVNGLVPGGNAERAAEAGEEGGEKIMFGDCLAAAELILRYADRTDASSVRTECLGYDATVEALGGMLAPLRDLDDDDDRNLLEATVVLTLKRVRRRPRLTVKLHHPPSQNLEPETLTLQAGDNLRTAMLTRGVKLNDPLAQRYDGKIHGGNCGGGSLCRTCAVAVVRGGELLSEPKQNERKMMEDEPRWRLACKSWVGYGMKEGEVTIRVNPRQW